MIMKKTILTLSALIGGTLMATAQSELLVGTGFEEAFLPGYDPVVDTNAYNKEDIGNFAAASGITVSGWQGGFGFPGNPDANGLPGMSVVGDVNEFAGKIRGDNEVAAGAVVAQGDDLATSLAKFTKTPNFFEVTIPVGSIVDLDSLTFEHRNATGGDGGRQFAVGTSLTNNIAYHIENAPGRNSDPSILSASIDLSSFQGLTDTSFQIYFMTQTTGTGASDHDIDNIQLTGTAIPEPSAAALLFGIGALAFVANRRRS